MNALDKAIADTEKKTRLYEEDGKDFDKWFSKQKYSFGAIPTWTQIAEMKRVWCVARDTERQSIKN
jgi:hypothetical protein